MERPLEFVLRRAAWRRILLGVLFIGALGYLAALREDVKRLETSLFELQVAHERDEREAGPVSPLLVDFQLDLPGRGEVFPALASSGSGTILPLALLNITNTARKPVAQVISAEIPGWSRPVEQTEIIGPQETRLVQIQPPLLPEALRNQEIRNERLDVRVTSPDGSTYFAESRPVLIHGGSDLFWGQKFANAQVAARWVTPHDPAVLELVSNARRHIARGRMAGYGAAGADVEAGERHVRDQVEAVFRALRDTRIGYVNSLFVMGEYLEQAQRVRLPGETLGLKTANCMDVSVAFASAMENLGLQPLLVIVPGHAFTAVRLTRDSEEILYLDLTVLPDGTLDKAVRRAESWLQKTPPEKVLVVDVIAARSLGFYPLVAATDPAPGPT